MHPQARIYVAGGDTLIGAAIVRALERNGHAAVLHPSAEEWPLTSAVAVDELFRRHQPEYVFVAAGRSGGIEANRRHPADLMIDNLLVGTHVCSAAWRHGVKKLLYLASSCCYPRECEQPMQVSHLGTAPLEPTSEAYATAKLAGIQLCRAIRRQHGAAFITAIPADVFGPGSKFDGEHSHVIPALITKMHAAKVTRAPFIELWGTGAPRREFLFADDLADACLVAMARYDAEAPINLGGGTELSIRDAAGMIAEVVGYHGEIRFDAARADGMPRKLLDSGVLFGLGWRPATAFCDALETTYRSFLDGLPAVERRCPPSSDSPTVTA